MVCKLSQGNKINIKKEKLMKITKLFNQSELKEKSDGNFIVECPSCGSDDSGYGGMILFVKSNTAYCYESRTWFSMKETFALQKGIIKCTEGRRKK